MLWVTPRFARSDLVFLPKKPSAIIRSLPYAQVLLPFGSPAFLPKIFPTRSLVARLFRGKIFLLPAGSRTCTSVSLTNRHVVPSRAKNEEEGGRGSRSPIHTTSKEDIPP